MNCEVLIPFMEAAHSRFETVRGRHVSRMRFLSFMCMGGRQNIRDAYFAVVADNSWKRLDFLEKPVYETLGEFINGRIGGNRLHGLFHAIVAECVRVASSMGINDNDDECLIPSQQRLMRDRIRIREQKVDGKYTSHRNIAHSGINGIRLQYRIEKDWKHNPAGEEHEIRRLY